MEWNTPERAAVGQCRERLKFAWWPEECEDGKTRWLCNIRVLEQLLPLFGEAPKWERLKTYRAEVEISR